MKGESEASNSDSSFITHEMKGGIEAPNPFQKGRWKYSFHFDDRGVLEGQDSVLCRVQGP